VPQEGSARTGPDERPPKAPDHRPTKGLERCDRHPGSPVVARCDGCGRPLCLSCATPVRGETFGAECLTRVLGADVTSVPESQPRAPDAVSRTVARVAFGLAVAATVLPWSRFGPGSAPFGAWSRSARWSLIAALAAIAGLVLALAQSRAWMRTPRWDAVVTTLGAAVVTASLLSVLFPPAFSRPWLGPWAAVASGAVAAGASFVAGRTATTRTTVRI